MFHDLDSTLAELLKRELPSMLAEQMSVTFATPDEDFPTASVILPAVNLFLYEFRDNRDLRNAEPPIQQTASGKVIRTRSPMHVDCRYLITAWAKAGALLPEQDEHQMLGAVLCVLARHRELPGDVLQGSMLDQPMAPRAIVLPMNQEQLRTRGEFWQALGGRPKAAFDYLVTVSVELGRSKKTSPVSSISRLITQAPSSNGQGS